MKTKYKYIRFEETEIPVGGKNKWQCINRYNHLLGEVTYYPKWKEWEFLPESDIGLTIVCLQDIAHFIGQLNEQGSHELHG